MKSIVNSFEVLSSHLYNLLEAESYSGNTLRDMRFILQALSSYMEINGLEEYTPEIGERFVAQCVSDLHICPSRISRAKTTVKKLNRLLQGLDGKDALLPDKTVKLDIPDGLMKSLTDYLAHCSEKGNRQSTMDYQYWICGRFLKNLYNLGCTEIKEVTGEHVQAAFLALGYTRYWERVSPFLRFLFNNGSLENDYSRIMRNHRRFMPLPAVYSPAEIALVEQSFDLSTASGIRNYAIVLFMDRYGIRACDVAVLTFDNIDLKNNRIRFTQQKTGDPWEGELFPEVKTALQNYIINVRPNIPEYPNIFISLLPPYMPINSAAINVMVWTHFRHAKLDIAGRRHGSRAFRSSIASNMVNDGVSTEVVRRVLGHGTKHALKHYAMIDIESMRLCPLPVPEPTGTFAEILSGKGASHRV